MFDDKPIGERFAELRKSKKDKRGKDMPIMQLAYELSSEKYIKDYTADIIRQEIGKVENKGKFPQLFLIKGYCNYFKVTSDYLLGIRDTKPVDENIAMIGKVTGLTDDAIATLKRVNANWSADEKDALNYILKDSDLFLDFMKWLSIYIDNQYTIPVTRDNKGICYQCGYSVDGENAIEFGKQVKDNKRNGGYDTIGIGIDILESHAMLKMQEIIDNWKSSIKKRKGSD